MTCWHNITHSLRPNLVSFYAILFKFPKFFIYLYTKVMLMCIACLCPNLVSVHFYALPILHFKFPKFLLVCILEMMVATLNEHALHIASSTFLNPSHQLQSVPPFQFYHMDKYNQIIHNIHYLSIFLWNWRIEASIRMQPLCYNYEHTFLPSSSLKASWSATAINLYRVAFKSYIVYSYCSQTESGWDTVYLQYNGV